MSSSSYLHYDHKEKDQYFSEAFAVFSELRKNNLMTDIVLTTSLDSQPCRMDENYGIEKEIKTSQNVKNEKIVSRM